MLQEELSQSEYRSNMIICQNIIENIVYKGVMRRIVGMYIQNYLTKRGKLKKLQQRILEKIKEKGNNNKARMEKDYTNKYK